MQNTIQTTASAGGFGISAVTLVDWWGRGHPFPLDGTTATAMAVVITLAGHALLIGVKCLFNREKSNAKGTGLTTTNVAVN